MDGLQDAKPIGWRARIGVIVPPSNTVNEAEFNRLKPDGVTYHFTRSPIHGDPAADGFVGLMNDVEIACDDMVRCNVDVIAYGCTSGSMAAFSMREAPRAVTAAIAMLMVAPTLEGASLQRPPASLPPGARATT